MSKRNFPIPMAISFSGKLDLDYFFTKLRSIIQNNERKLKPIYNHKKLKHRFSYDHRS